MSKVELLVEWLQNNASDFNMVGLSTKDLRVHIDQVVQDFRERVATCTLGFIRLIDSATEINEFKEESLINLGNVFHYLLDPANSPQHDHSNTEFCYALGMKKRELLKVLFEQYEGHDQELFVDLSTPNWQGHNAVLLAHLWGPQSALLFLPILHTKIVTFSSFQKEVLYLNNVRTTLAHVCAQGSLPSFYPQVFGIDVVTKAFKFTNIHNQNPLHLICSATGDIETRTNEISDILRNSPSTKLLMEIDQQGDFPLNLVFRRKDSAAIALLKVFLTCITLTELTDMLFDFHEYRAKPAILDIKDVPMLSVIINQFQKDVLCDLFMGRQVFPDLIRKLTTDSNITREDYQQIVNRNNPYCVVDENGDTVLHHACRNNLLADVAKICERMVDMQVGLPENAQHPLAECVPITELLVPNAQGITPLHLATGDVFVLIWNQLSSILRDKTVQDASGGKSLLLASIEQNDFNKLRLLLKHDEYHYFSQDVFIAVFQRGNRDLLTAVMGEFEPRVLRIITAQLFRKGINLVTDATQLTQQDYYEVMQKRSHFFDAQGTNLLKQACQQGDEVQVGRLCGILKDQLEDENSWATVSAEEVFGNIFDNPNYCRILNKHINHPCFLGFRSNPLFAMGDYLAQCSQSKAFKKQSLDFINCLNAILQGADFPPHAAGLQPQKMGGLWIASDDSARYRNLRKQLKEAFVTPIEAQEYLDKQLAKETSKLSMAICHHKAKLESANQAGFNARFPRSSRM